MNTSHHENRIGSLVLATLGLFAVPLTIQAQVPPGTTILPVTAGTDVQITAITGEEGLSSGSVYGVAQDAQGFLWFATADGLNRYDGSSFRVYRSDRSNPNSLSSNALLDVYAQRDNILWLATFSGEVERFDPATETFTHYRYDPNNPNSLSGNRINPRTMYQDRQGAMWFGTVDSGLNRLDLATGTFTHYRHNPNDANSLSSDKIINIFQDSEGMMWIGTQDAGLNRLDSTTGKITHYLANPTDPHALMDLYVTAIYEDKAGVFWIGTMKGFATLDRKTGKFTRFLSDPALPDAITINEITQFIEDSMGNFWMGTGGAGVLKLDRQRQRISQYKNDPNNPHSLRNNFIGGLIQEDPSGTLWVGTQGGGANRFSIRPPKFAHYKRDPNNPNSVADNFILSIFEDHTGTVWIGNDHTLNRWDRGSNTWSIYRNDPKNPASITNGSVTSTQEDPDGTLWFGTYRGGLNQYDPKTGRFKNYRFDAGNPHSLSDDTIRAVYRDSQGVLWVGGWDYGLNRLDRTTGTFERYLNDPANPASLGSNSITKIYEDREHTLWVATEGGGLNRFDAASGTFRRYQNDPKDLKSLPNNAIRVLYEDKAGQFWVGTVAGLCAFDRKNGTFTTFTDRDGLPNNTIQGILEDDQGNLWISTSNGLSRFNPKARTFRNYDALDGLQANEFNVFGVFFKSPRTGEMYFGGINGFNVFDPNKVTDNSFVPPVMLTDFRLFGKSVPVGGDSMLKRTISQTSHLELAYEQNNLALEFASLSYVAPTKNRYRYKMQGFDADWRTVDSKERLAVYTNLNAGDYVFSVQGTNEDGVWNTAGTSLRISVTPPWWASWWFQSIAVAALLALIWAGYQWRVESLHQRRRQLEALVAERTSQLATVNKELETFAYSVSHDLRAPLRAISGFSAILARRHRDSLNEEGRHYMDNIVQTGERMGQLIDDLLTYSRLGRSSTRTVPVALGEVLSVLSEEFTARLEETGGTLEIAPDLPVVTGDKTLLTAIFTNLFDNALTYHSADRPVRVTVTHQTTEGAVLLKVSDNGIGVPKEHFEKIFNIFQRLHSEDQYPGTGIGLATVKKSVELLGGQVWVESEVGQGSTFFVQLPRS